jgi:nitrogen-specific signal transduction histidine kinase/CheY-like chemotaxis protein
VNLVTSKPVDAKVLVVDDMLLHLQTIKLYLESSGFQVICSTDTNNAWRLVIEEQPDLVILDVIIPGGNGLKLLEKIKSQFPNIAVIIMTAYGNENVAASAIKMGALDYLRKPVRYNNLSNIVEKALVKQRQLCKQAVKVNTLEHAFAELQVSAESILGCISAAVVAVDNNLNISIYNQKAKQFLISDDLNIKGRNFYEVFPCFKHSALLKYTLENGRGVQLYEVEIDTANGTKILNINTDIIYHHHQPIGAVAVINDVTDLKHKECLLKEKEKLAIVGQMAACMAHEIKNPLTAIKGFAQILASKIEDDSSRKYLQVINSEINRMSQVIQDFLLLARPKPPEFMEADINQLVREVMLIIESQALLKNINISMALSDNIPPLFIDQGKIKQVLLNLSQNALESMNINGNLGIATSLLPDLREIRLDVTDTGCGIAKEKINDLGVPFITTKSNGTGLGLSISFSIIEQHKGRVEVQSEVGQGTTFSIYLPLRDK